MAGKITISRRLFHADCLDLKSLMYLPTIVTNKGDEKTSLAVQTNLLYLINFTSKNEYSWSEKCFTISSRNLGKVKHFFSEIVSKFTDPKFSLFVNVDGRIQVNNEFAIHRPIRTVVHETNHYGKCMIADPGCVEKDGTAYEGIALTINYKSNVAFLTWPEIQSLNDIIQGLNCTSEATFLLTSLQIAERYKTFITRDQFQVNLREKK